MGNNKNNDWDSWDYSTATSLGHVDQKDNTSTTSSQSNSDENRLFGVTIDLDEDDQEPVNSTKIQKNQLFHPNNEVLENNNEQTNEDDKSLESNQEPEVSFKTLINLKFSIAKIEKALKEVDAKKEKIKKARKMDSLPWNDFRFLKSLSGFNLNFFQVNQDKSTSAQEDNVSTTSSQYESTENPLLGLTILFKKNPELLKNSLEPNDLEKFMKTCFLKDKTNKQLKDLAIRKETNKQRRKPGSNRPTIA